MKTVFSTCGMCLARCPIEVDVAEGRPVFIRGNRHSPHKEALCPRGGAGIALYNDNERPHTPLIREGARGEGRFRPASWDEALDYTAARLKEITEKYGSQTLLWSERGGPYTDLNKAFLRAVGTPNFCNHDSTCSHNVNEACFWVTGHSRNDFIYDYKNCRFMVFQARNPFESLVVKEVNDILDARESGCKMAVIDTRASVTACKADIFLMPRPGTDYAVNLGIIHFLLDEGLYNSSYAAERLYGLEELKRFIRPYDLRWAAGETGLEAESLANLAREAARSAPAVIWYPGWMTSRYVQSGMVSRSSYIINALLGSIGAPGGLLLASGPEDVGTKGLKGFSGLFSAPDVPRADGIGSKIKLANSGGSLIHRAMASLCDDLPYPLRAYVAWRHDPLSSLPDMPAQKKLLDKIDFMASVTFSWSDTAFYSDVILPLPMYLESDSLIGVKPGPKPQFFVRRKAVPPRFDTREGWSIIGGLAERLGIKQLAFKSIEDVWAWQLEGTGLSINDFDSKGFVDLTDAPARKEVFPLPNVTGKIELVRPVLDVDKAVKGDVTGGNSVLEPVGANGLEPYRAPVAAPEGFFRLTIGRSALHTHAHTQNNPMLSAKMPENEVWIHPSAASVLRINKGGQVRIIAENGAEYSARARVDAGIHPEAVFMVHGFGHRLPMESRAFGRGAGDQNLMVGGLYKEDSLGLAIALQEHFVRVLPADDTDAAGAEQSASAGKKTASARTAVTEGEPWAEHFQYFVESRNHGSDGRVIFINEARCINCKACEVHCQNKNAAPPELRLGLHVSKGPFVENGRFVMSSAFVICRPCTDAPCVAACPTGAMRKRSDGLVYVEENCCQGCDACRMVCPWNVPQLDKHRKIMMKCDGCRELADQGLPPACVASCVSHALMCRADAPKRGGPRHLHQQVPECVSIRD